MREKSIRWRAAFFVDDAGMCPEGRHAQNGLCVEDPTYACVIKPASCGIPFDCACAGALCQNGYECSGTTQHEVDCTLEAPSSDKLRQRGDERGE